MIIEHWKLALGIIAGLSLAAIAFAQLIKHATGDRECVPTQVPDDKLIEPGDFKEPETKYFIINPTGACLWRLKGASCFQKRRLIDL